MRSNDRPEIRLVVRSLTYTAKSFQDLNFLIPDNFEEGDPPPDKFLIFFDDRKEAERACKYLRAQFPPSLRDKIRWFHSVMTDKTRQDDVEAMRKGENWGFCSTDSFGMVKKTNSLESISNSLELRVWTSRT
jgi:superfamily II DNA helicase RecQ